MNPISCHLDLCSPAPSSNPSNPHVFTPSFPFHVTSIHSGPCNSGSSRLQALERLERDTERQGEVVGYSQLLSLARCPGTSAFLISATFPRSSVAPQSTSVVVTVVLRPPSSAPSLCSLSLSSDPVLSRMISIFRITLEFEFALGRRWERS